MGSRLQLQTLLETLVENVYFQQPINIQMQYPCIVYARESSELRHADNRLYNHTKRYQVTVIDHNPDSEIPDRVLELPLCAMDRSFVADDLYHYVFTLFF